MLSRVSCLLPECNFVRTVNTTSRILLIGKMCNGSFCIEFKHLLLVILRNAENNQCLASTGITLLKMAQGIQVCYTTMCKIYHDL